MESKQPEDQGPETQLIASEPPPDYGAGEAERAHLYPPPTGPAPGYTVPAGPAPVEVVYQAPTTIGVPQIICNAYPIPVVCSNCQQHVTTRIAYVDGMAVYITALVICCFGGILGCCLIPFFVDGCKDVYHSWPICNHAIGTYKRL